MLHDIHIQTGHAGYHRLYDEIIEKNSFGKELYKIVRIMSIFVPYVLKIEAARK